MFKTNGRVTMRGGRATVTARNQPQSPVNATRSRVQANTDFGTMFATGGGASSQYAVQNPSLDGFLQGFINTDDESMLRKVYKDIYDNDPICGGTIDLMSELPFSDFTLTGVDKKIVDKYQESMDRLNIKTLLPEITAEYLTFSKFCGTLIYQQKAKVFTDLMPHDPDYLQVQDMPFYSLDPIITVRNDKRVKDFLSSQDPEVERYRKGLSPKLLEAMAADQYVLDPLTAVYLERRSLMKRGPISILRRVIPIYFLEKQLFRGTLVEASKRLRAIGHIKVGQSSPGGWVPTDEEMEEYLEWFQQADQDPLGAFVVTRPDVEYNEIRQGGEFWKITDISDQTGNMKMRAMGVSEAFLSGDVSYDTAEVAVSLFMDHTRNYRDRLTYQFFTTKIFPIIAITNGFIKQRKSETTADLHRRVQFEINNVSNFEIPNIQWHKQLTADPNNTMLETLERLGEMGVPATLRAICAAGNISLEALLRDIEDEKPVIEKLEEMGYDMSKFKPNGMGGGDDSGLDGFEGHGDQGGPGGPGGDDGGPGLQGGGPLGEGPGAPSSGGPGGPGGPQGHGGPPGLMDQSSVRQLISSFRMRGFMSRDWDSVAHEPYTYTKTGQKKSLGPFEHTAQKRENDTILRAVEANRDPHVQIRNVQRGRTHKMGGLPFAGD